MGEVLDEHLADVSPDGVMGLLLIDTVWVDPAYRGQGVASHALWRLLRLFEGSMMPDLAVAHLVPIDKPKAGAEWERVAELDPEEAKERLGLLHDLFARSGFLRVADSDVVFFPLEREARLPSTSVYLEKAS